MIDVQSIFLKVFVEQYANHIAFIVAVVIFIFRYEISYEFNLTNRERNKLTSNLLLFLVVISIATVGYLAVEEHIFVLYFILTYFLYMFGVFDSIVEKMRKIWLKTRNLKFYL